MKLVVIVGNVNLAEMVYTYKDRKQGFNDLLTLKTAFA
jgi:hypothetical protein